MRLFKPNVRKMEEKKDVYGLLRALTDKDRVVCLKAAEAIERIIREKLRCLGISEEEFRLFLQNRMSELKSGDLEVPQSRAPFSASGSSSAS